MKIQKLGTLHSCFKAKFGTPRQSQIAKHSHGYIQIDKKWEPAKCLKGLEEFSHAWVLFWFHENTNLAYRPVVRPPRLDGKGIGALATRSPLRPNPIGLSLVKVDRILKDKMFISGIDIIEGTPVLDIKPYIHDYDSVSNSKKGWLENIQDAKLEVDFTAEALEQIELFKRPNLKETLMDILSSDIRNKSDKRITKHEKTLGFYYEDLNIIFVSSESTVKVLKVERLCYNKGNTTT